MSASLGTDEGKSLNVELNIVPFIDLMSCLTAFLLVTAVWVNIAQVPTTPKGRERDGIIEAEEPKLSLLVSGDQMWLGVSRIDEFTAIQKVGGKQDWDALAVALAKQRAPGAYFEHDRHLELAAESTPEGVVQYGDVIHAMDVAMQAGFADVQITDAKSLSARPH